MAMTKGISAIGRRKAASARVYLTPVEGEDAEASIVVNNRAFEKGLEHGVPLLKEVTTITTRIML